MLRGGGRLGIPNLVYYEYEETWLTAPLTPSILTFLQAVWRGQALHGIKPRVLSFNAKFSTKCAFMYNSI